MFLKIRLKTTLQLAKYLYLAKTKFLHSNIYKNCLDLVAKWLNWHQWRAKRSAGDYVAECARKVNNTCSECGPLPRLVARTRLLERSVCADAIYSYI